MAEEPHRIRQAGQDVLTGQGGVLSDDVFWAVPGSQELDHRLRRETGGRNDRAAIAEIGIDRDGLSHDHNLAASAIVGPTA